MGDWVSVEMKNNITITVVFLRFVIIYTVGALFWLFAAVMIYFVLDAAGEVLPANHMEAQLNASADEIQSVSKVTDEQIPAECMYGVYERTGDWLYGTFSSEESGQAWASYEENDIYAQGKGYYRFFVRDAGEICIVKYKIETRFRNEYLDKLLPRPDLLMVVSFAAMFLLHTVLVSRYFGKYMRARLRILLEVAEKIRNQDLEFAEEHSGLREVNEILSSLYQMKKALKESLYRQWDVEKSRDEQIAALAHDIKTPLTVIRGNAELLAEGELAEDEQEYNRDILSSAAVMENYLQSLNELLMADRERASGEEGDAGENDIRRDNAGEDDDREKDIRRDDDREKEIAGIAADMVSCMEFADKLIEQARLLSSARQCPAAFQRNDLHGKIQCNETQILRAWSNILGNAMDYGPENGRIQISFKMRKDEGKEYLAAAAADEGPGFSRQDLMHATEQFYQGDRSRNSKTHYGIGLHTAEKFVKRQGGKLVIENGEATGARVTILLEVRT